MCATLQNTVVRARGEAESLKSSLDGRKRHKFAQSRRLCTFPFTFLANQELGIYVFSQLRIPRNGTSRAVYPAYKGVFSTMNTMIKKVMYVVLGCSLALLFAGQANAGICPAVGSASDCGVQINVTAQSGGVASAFTATSLGNGNPYDGVEDTLVGLTNNSGSTITSITLTATDNTNGGLGFLDGDGPCLYNSALCNGTTGYEGPNVTFSGSCVGMFDCDSITVNFTGGLADGASAWFALEGDPASLTGSGGIGGPTPEPASLMLLGTGLVGFFLRRRSA